MKGLGHLKSRDKSLMEKKGPTAPLPPTELAHKRTFYLIYFHLCGTLLAILFPLQNQLFFLLLCLGLMSVLFLYQNPDWGLASIKLLSHQKHYLVRVQAGELIVSSVIMVIHV